MKRLSIDDIRGPLVPGADLVLGSAGRRGPWPGRCPDARSAACGPLPTVGSCPCGALSRPI